LDGSPHDDRNCCHIGELLQGRPLLIFLDSFVILTIFVQSSLCKANNKRQKYKNILTSAGGCVIFNKTEQESMRKIGKISTI
jgi:hypothetical protein